MRYYQRRYLASLEPQREPLLSQVQQRQLQLCKQQYQQQHQVAQRPLPTCGVGLTVHLFDGLGGDYHLAANTPVRVRIRSISQGGSAEASGALMVGDFVLEVNGISLHALPRSDITRLIAGPAFTTVTLTLQRADERLTPLSGVEFRVLLARLP